MDNNTVDNETPWQPKTDSIPVVKPRKLTRKQMEFIRQLVANPKQSATAAAEAVYNVKNRETAQVIASENLSKPMVMTELAKYSGKAELVVIEAMGADKSEYKFNPDSKMYELIETKPDHAIRLRAADSVLDRLHGKATIKTESVSTAVNLNLNLSDVVDTP